LRLRGGREWSEWLARNVAARDEIDCQLLQKVVHTSYTAVHVQSSTRLVHQTTPWCTRPGVTSSTQIRNISSKNRPLPNVLKSSTRVAQRCGFDLLHGGTRNSSELQI
jgi:hypothetical protein